MLCYHILHIFCTCPWIIFPCVAFFLHHLALEPSLLDLVFYCFLFPSNSAFQNQYISLLMSLYAIFEILKLQETLTSLYYSGKTSKTYFFISSSSFSYLSLIFLKSKFRLFNSLYHISGSWLVSLILHLLHLFLTYFRIYCI